MTETAKPHSENDETSDDVTFPVIEERVTVHKTLADNGGVRLRKFVRTDEVTVDEPLVAQSANLTRVAIGRDVDGPVEVRYENGVTIIPVVEERLVIRRQLVLVEEIHVHSTTHTYRAPQTVRVRREEMIIERQAPGSDVWQPDEKPEASDVDAARLTEE